MVIKDNVTSGMSGGSIDATQGNAGTLGPQSSFVELVEKKVLAYKQALANAEILKNELLLVMSEDKLKTMLGIPKKVRKPRTPKHQGVTA